MQELSEDNLQTIITENSFVVVQYSATWCGNCRIMKPKFKKLASRAFKLEKNPCLYLFLRKTLKCSCVPNKR